MRLVHLSDLHLGYRQYQRQTATGINQREADVAAVFRGVIDRVIALAPERIVISPGPCTPTEAGVSLEVIERLAGR